MSHPPTPQRPKAACLLLISLCILFGCGKSGDEGQLEDAQGEPAGGAEQAFDLERVLADYEDAELRVLDISERDLDGSNALAVTLSVPLNPGEDHQSYFNVAHKDNGVVDGSWVLSPSGRVAYFADIQPNSPYRVTVHKGLIAATGKELTTSVSEEIKSRNIQPSVSFDTSGSFLPDGLSTGLPIATVNVDAVDINFHRIRPDSLRSFLAFVRQNRHYYYQLEHLSRLGELAYTARFDLNPPANTRVKMTLPVEDIAELKEPGVYLAVMKQAGSYDYRSQATYFSVTDLGLHARVYENQIDVYVSSLKSADPLSGVRVSLLDGNGQTLAENRTTRDGLASFVSPENHAQLIVAESNDYFSAVELIGPALDLSEFDPGTRPQHPAEMFLYAPRDLYRPGETAHFSGLLRDGDGQPTPAIPLKANIKQPDGTVLKSFSWHAEESGYYSYDFPIPEEGNTGDWELEVSAGNKPISVYRFKVEEFLPERLKLTFNEGQDAPMIVAADGDLAVPVRGEYLYGAPASGNRLSTIVRVRQARTPVPTLKGYEFGDINDTTSVQSFNLEDINLDAGGIATVTVESRWSESRSPLDVTLISSLYESGGRPVTRTYSSLVWPGEELIGVRSSFGEKNPQPNSRVSFEIVKATRAGELLGARALEVSLIREDRQYFWEYSDNEGWHYEFTEKEYPVINQSVDLAAGKASKLELPVEWGRYRFEVKDPRDGAITSVRFHAGRDWYARWKETQTDQAARPDRISMALDKEHYGPGDTARLEIVPPEAGEALIMVEADKPLWFLRRSLPAGSTTIEIPIAPDWNRHNIYVSAVVLKAGDRSNKITPRRAFGLIHLPLDRSERKLEISFDVPEKIVPGKTFDASLKVARAGGAALSGQTYLTLAAVDVGVLSISNYDTPDPYEGFFGQRRYGVDVRDLYGKVIELNDHEAANLRFGGDADLSRGGQRPVSEVRIVSLFSGLVTVAPSGEVRIPLEIPDFNGRLRLMAVAFSENQFGSNEQELTVAAPLVAQIALPRFLAAGDASTAALDLHNLSGETQELSVIVRATHPVRIAEKVHSLVLQDGERTTLKVPLRAAQAFGQSTISMEVEGTKLETLQRDWKLGIRPAYPAVTRSSFKMLEQNQSVFVDGTDLGNLMPDSIQALLSVSPHADLQLQNHLHYLLQYPYGCLEQTSSTIYPLVWADPQTQATLGLRQITEDERLKRIEAGLTRLAGMQLPNGGYGMWSRNDSEAHYLTVYVADFLLTAREQGFEIPQSMLDKTLKRLGRYLTRENIVRHHYSSDPRHYALAYRAYAAYVLSRVNQAQLGALRTLFDKHIDDAKSGLPQLHLGLALMKQGDKKRGEAAIDKALSHEGEREGYYGDYGSEIRDLAMSIHLMLNNDVKPARAREMAYALAEEVRRRQWLSTQERNALFLAGMMLESGSPSQWEASLFVGAAQEALSREQGFRRLFNSAEIQQGVRLELDSEQSLYSSVEISGYTSNPPPEESNELEIERTYFSTDGSVVTPDEVQVGELYLVHLEIAATQRTPDGLIVDLQPAGLELENQNLENAIKLDEFKIDDTNIAELVAGTRLKYQEFRDDRYVAAIDLTPGQLSHAFYLVRAVTPGDYRVPSPYVEDMYRPEYRAIGATLPRMKVVNPR